MSITPGAQMGLSPGDIHCDIRPASHANYTEYPWLQIIYKVIAYIPPLNQIFDDKNKNGSV